MPVDYLAHAHEFNRTSHRIDEAQQRQQQEQAQDTIATAGNASNDQEEEEIWDQATQKNEEK